MKDILKAMSNDFSGSRNFFFIEIKAKMRGTVMNRLLLLPEEGHLRVLVHSVSIHV